MTRIMFEIPSDLTIRKVVITPTCISGGEPMIIRDLRQPRAGIGTK